MGAGTRLYQGVGVCVCRTSFLLHLLPRHRQNCHSTLPPHLCDKEVPYSSSYRNGKATLECLCHCVFDDIVHPTSTLALLMGLEPK